MRLKVTLLLALLCLCSCQNADNASDAGFMDSHFNMESETIKDVLSNSRAILAFEENDSILYVDLRDMSKLVMSKDSVINFFNKVIFDNDISSGRLFLLLMNNETEVLKSNLIKDYFFQAKDSFARFQSNKLYGIPLDSLTGSKRKIINDSIHTIMLVESKKFTR
jgi:hypothetical protein